MGRHSLSRSRSTGRQGIGAKGAYDEGQDGYRVHIADLGINCSQKDLERQFNKFGETRELWLARYPPCFAFIVYKHKSDAEKAIKEMDGRVVCSSRVRVTWAKPRIKGTNSSRQASSRYDDSLRRRRSPSRRRRSNRRSQSRSRSRSARRNSRRSRSLSKSRDRKNRSNRSRSTDKHRRGSTSRIRSHKNREEKKNSRSRSPGKVPKLERVEVPGGDHTKNGINRTENSNEISTRSLSNSRYSEATLENGNDIPVLTNEFLPQHSKSCNLNDSIYHEEDDEFGENKDMIIHNGDTIITDYQSDVEED